MPKIPHDDYKMVELYVRTVLERFGVPGESLGEAVDELMHPLTAVIDDGVSSSEFIPYMRAALAELKRTG